MNDYVVIGENLALSFDNTKKEWVPTNDYIVVGENENIKQQDLENPVTFMRRYVGDKKQIYVKLGKPARDNIGGEKARAYREYKKMFVKSSN